MITLAWLKATSQEFKVFIQNRVISIRILVAPEK